MRSLFTKLHRSQSLQETLHDTAQLSLGSLPHLNMGALICILNLTPVLTMMLLPSFTVQ